MVWTAANLLADVRLILQDKDSPTRYSDEHLLQAAQIMVGEVRRLRPDYFFADLRSGVPDFYTPANANRATPLPIPDLIRASATTFVAGFVELVDDQFATDGRAAGLMALLASSLMRPAPAP